MILIAGETHMILSLARRAEMNWCRNRRVLAERNDPKLPARAVAGIRRPLARIAEAEMSIRIY